MKEEIQPVNVYDVKYGDIIKLPIINFLSKDNLYDGLLMVPSYKMHESEWGCITVVGIKDHIIIEKITVHSDHIIFFPSSIRINIDCPPSSIGFNYFLHGNFKFKIKYPGASLNIEVV